MENVMRKIKIEKVVLNCGAIGDKLEKSAKLLKIISGRNAKKTISRKRIPSLGVRPGLEVGCKVTLRGEEAEKLLARLFVAVGSQISKKQVKDSTLNFGIKEYIEIPGITFQRDIGMLGLDVSMNFIRAGFGIKNKKLKYGKIPERHRIKEEEIIKFMQENFKIKII